MLVRLSKTNAGPDQASTSALGQSLRAPVLLVCGNKPQLVSIARPTARRSRSAVDTKGTRRHLLGIVGIIVPHLREMTSLDSFLMQDESEGETRDAED